LKSVEYGTILVAENFQRIVERDIFVGFNIIVLCFILPKYSILGNFRAYHCLKFENITYFISFKNLKTKHLLHIKWDLFSKCWKSIYTKPTCTLLILVYCIVQPFWHFSFVWMFKLMIRKDSYQASNIFNG